MKRIPLPNYISRSGAKFESNERFKENAYVVNTADSYVEKAGIPLMKIGDNEFATSKEELHCFVIGDSGCGKTRRVILPTIHILSKTGESMVISDPKGELYRTTANTLKKKGYNVKLLNFRNPSRGNRWNPLNMIEQLYRKGDRQSKDKAISMLEDLVSVLSQKIEGDDPYWAMSAANVMRGVALIILDYGDTGELTFENIGNTARKIYQEINSNKGFRPGPNQLEQFLEKLPDNSPIEQSLAGLITNAKETQQCIMSTFESMISLYCNQEMLKDLFATSEFDMISIGMNPTALFIVLPDDSEALYPIATVLVKQIYSSLVSLADEQPQGKLPNRVTFLLDEFANFAKMPSIQSMLTAARSRGIRFVLVCQSMDQLRTKYNEDGMETLISNCRVWVYMSCRNLPFLRRLEELVGYYMSPYTNEKYPLIGIDELQHFEMGQILVLNDRCNPIVSFLPDYEKYDFGDDGHGIAEEMPIESEPINRTIFDLKKAFVKVNEVKKHTNKVEKVVEKNDADGLRASIFGKMSEMAELSAKHQEEKKSIDDIIAKIDAKIFELEIQEAQETPKGVMELFREGHSVAAAQKCVDSLGNDPMATKNNLAFLLRFSKAPINLIKAPFSLDIAELLDEGVKNGDVYAILNFALYKIEAGQYKEAVDLLNKYFTKSAWKLVCQFWFNEIWIGREKHQEGALVCFMANYVGAESFGEHDKIMKVVSKIKYRDFVNSEYFETLRCKEEDNPIENILSSLIIDEDSEE